MNGKTVLITGANSGIGFATAAALAAKGASIIMVCRDGGRGGAAREKIAAMATGAPPMMLVADLSVQAAIRDLAPAVRARYVAIDVLINNAGAVYARRELTVDGIEKTFATNHLAPFLLTHLLLDQLKAAPAARVVNVASALHNARPDFLDDLQGERRYQFLSAYRLSKLGVILFTYELARRLEGTGITVNCLEPGPSRTCFGDNMTGMASLFPRLMKRLPFFHSAEVGAETVIFAAASPTLDGVTGAYLTKSKPACSKPITYDREIALRHWAISEALTGLGDAGARSHSSDGAPRRNVRGPQQVTNGAAARTSEEHSRALSSVRTKDGERIRL
jgi:retinol dehydrogenase 14